MIFPRAIASAFLGRPMAETTSGYNAATRGRRTINFGATTRGVSSLALADGPMLTARARKTVMDNPVASTGVGAFIAEVIGTGLRPHSRHPDPAKRRAIEKEFSLWVPQSSAARRIGPGGKPDSLQDFFLQQQLVCRNVIEAGEAFARYRYRLASDLSPLGLRVPLQIDLIEPEQLAFWRMTGEQMAPGNIIRASIEFNQIHERVAYYFYREHPGDATIWPNAFEVTRVPAQEVLHVMEYLRGNQIRGITALASVLIALNDLDEFIDSTRMKQKLGAFLFAWKKSLQPDDSGYNAKGQVGTDVAPAGSQYVESQPGSVTILDANIAEDFGFHEPTGVPNTYEAYVRRELQQISSALRVTYDMLTGDNSSTTFMNARVRLIAIRRQWRQFQKAIIVHQFCRPVWREWIDAAALAGVIDAKDYRKKPEDYLAVEWLPQPWEWVDPVKDLLALRMEMESCLTSREAVVAGRGRDVDEVDAEIQRDHIREQQMGIEPIFGAYRITETIAEKPGDNPAEDEIPGIQNDETGTDTGAKTKK
jgi:lambda family phage portal protein